MAGRKEYEMLFQLNAQLGGGFNSAFSKAQAEITNMQKKIQALSKTQSDIAAYQRQQSAVESTRNKLRVLQQQYDNIQKEIKETEGYSSSLQNKLLAKQQQIDKTTNSLNNQTAKLDSMGNALREAGVDTDNLTKESAELSAKMSDLKNKQEEAARSAGQFGNQTAQAFETAKAALTAAGLVRAYREIFEAATACVKASIEFESAITGVFKTVDGTDAQLNNITQGIKDMSTEMPATTTEIAAVAEAAGQLGIATDDVLDFTKVMIDLGESTNLSADEAATSLAKFANITRTDADNYSRLGSVVVDLGNNFATTEKDIVAMSTRLASAGSIAGLSEPEIMALAAAMSSVGIEAEAGGTAMAQTLNAVETAVATNSAELKEFARVSGMSAKEFADTWNNAPIQAIQSFIAGLGSLDENGESTVLVLEELGLTGIRQSNMLKSLGLAAETMNNSVATANKAWAENTALTNEANKRYATTESQLKMMKNQYSNLKVAVGDAMVPALKSLVNVSSDVLDGATDFVSQNPAVVQSVGTFVGVMATATGGMVAFNAAAKIAQSLNLVSLFTNPAMLAVAGGAAAVAAIVGIASAYEEAQEAARQYGDEVAAAAENYKQAMNTSAELEEHIAEWRTLNATIASGTAPVEEVNAAKEKLKANEEWLIANYGIYMDNDNSVSEEEIASLEARNEELRETARLQAEIALYNAKESYEAAKDKVGDTQQKRDALSSETTQMAKEQSILNRHSASWQRTLNSDKYKNASYDEQNQMFNDAMSAINQDMQEIGSDYYFNHMAGVETTAMQLGDTIDKNQKKINKYNQELLEYSESAAEYKQATRDILSMEISDIPTESLEAFGEVARTIGEQAANAELNASELEAYANQLTEVAHAAGLIPEDQRIVFNADGALNVIQEVTDGVDNLNGKTAVIDTDANTEYAIMKIGELEYKVLEFDESTGIATLSADGTNASMQINIATGEVRQFDTEEAEAYLNANKDDLDKNVEAAKTKLSTIPESKTVTITAFFKSVGEKVKSMFGFARGTNYALSGAHWVGEEGPELMWFNGGERVMDSRRSADVAKKHAMAMQELEEVSGSPAMQSYISNSMQYMSASRVEPVYAKNATQGGHYQITIAPQFTVEGGNIDGLENKLSEFSDIVVGQVIDVLEERGIDAKRGAYA